MDAVAQQPVSVAIEAGCLTSVIFRVWGLGFRGLGLRGLGFRGLGFRGLGFRCLGFRV